MVLRRRLRRRRDTFHANPSHRSSKSRLFIVVDNIFNAPDRGRHPAPVVRIARDCFSRIVKRLARALLTREHAQRFRCLPRCTDPPMQQEWRDRSQAYCNHISKNRKRIHFVTLIPTRLAIFTTSPIDG